MFTAREKILSRCGLLLHKRRTIDPQCLGKIPARRAESLHLAENAPPPFQVEPRQTGTGRNLLEKAKSWSIPKQFVWEPYKRVKANRAAAGVDDQSNRRVRGRLEEQSVQTLESHALGQSFSAAGEAHADRQARWRKEAIGYTHGQCQRTGDGKHLGWAEMCHPFHPLRGARFPVLKKRRVGGVDILILRGLERGTFSVARESTDWADPTSYNSLGVVPRQLNASLERLVHRPSKDVPNKVLG